MTRTEAQIKATNDRIDEVERYGTKEALSWLRSAYHTHEEGILELRARIADLRALLQQHHRGLLTVREAQLLDVCRICRGPSGAPFTLNYGEEFAHDQCLREMKADWPNGSMVISW
jgi:hypothetical protein